MSDEKNEVQFLEMLKEVMPELHYVFTLMVKDDIRPSEAMEIIHKVGMAKRLDDGYGKIIVECKDHQVTRVRMLADKVLKPYGAEKEFDI